MRRKHRADSVWRQQASQQRVQHGGEGRTHTGQAAELAPYSHHPNNSKQHGALAKMGNMQVGLETLNQLFFSGAADHALRLGPYMRISYYRENFNMDTGGRMRIGKS